MHIDLSNPNVAKIAIERAKKELGETFFANIVLDAIGNELIVENEKLHARVAELTEKTTADQAKIAEMTGIISQLERKPKGK